MRLSASNSGQKIPTMSLRDAVKRTDFHLNPPGIVVSASKVYEPEFSRIVFKIEINVPALVVPPSSIVSSIANLYCTITTKYIVIIIISTELLAIECSCKWVSRSDASKATNSQWILISSTSYFKHIVVKVGSGLVLKFKIYPELPLAMQFELDNAYF